nr:hypothetical protein [Vibrio furnissii]
MATVVCGRLVYAAFAP